MKNKYSKPQVSVESLIMDYPIASNCKANVDDMEALIAFGYFGQNDRGITCSLTYIDPDGTIAGENDTVCYHSNVQQSFLS